MRATPVRIVYILDYWAGARGGTERQLQYLVRNLDRRRFAPRLVVFRRTPALSADAFGCPVDVLHIGTLRSVRTVQQLAALSRTIRADGVRVAHVLFNDASVAAPLFCRLGGARVVASRRDLGFWYSPGRLAALRLSNLFVDRVVANSLAVARNVSAREAIPEERIRVIYNGYQEDAVSPEPPRRLRARLGIRGGDSVIGVVGHLSRLKRPGDVLAAFASLHGEFPNAHLVFAGDGEERRALSEIALALDLAGSVHLLGSVDDAVSLVRASDVCVLCSESEGLSNAVIEYLASGKPTVCTDVGGNRELIRDGENGFLVPVGDVVALHDRIRRILADAALAARLGRRAKESIGSRFSMTDMVNAYMELYDELVAARLEPIRPDPIGGLTERERCARPGSLRDAERG